MIHLLRVAVPGVWIGLIVGLSFIETPLKFLAPGMTLPIALGVGRLVLTAANIASVILLLLVTFLSVVPPRASRAGLWTISGLWLVLTIQVLVIRPPLNARSDAISAGIDPGPSLLHLLYIATDVLLIALLITNIWLTDRQRIRTTRVLYEEAVDV